MEKQGQVIEEAAHVLFHDEFRDAKGRKKSTRKFWR